MKRLIEFVLRRAAGDHPACCLAVEEKQKMMIGGWRKGTWDLLHYFMLMDGSLTLKKTS